MEFPLAFASDSLPFQALLSPLYSYRLSRKLLIENKNSYEKTWEQLKNSKLMVS